MLRVGFPVHVEGELDEGTEALLARTQFILRALALRDIAVQGNGQHFSCMPVRPDAHLNGKHCSILSSMTTIVADDLPALQTIPDALQKLRCQIRTIVKRGHPDQFVAAIAQAFAGLPIHIENGPILIVEKESIGCVIHQDAEARLARAQFILHLLALREVSDQRQKPSSTLLERSNANFHGERGAIFAAMMAFERDRFSREPVLRELRNRPLVKIRVEKAPMLADQFFAAIAQVLAALTIDVENDRIDVQQKEAVDRIVNECAEARLARAQLVLCSLVLRDVAYQAQETTAALIELADANLHREGCAVLAFVASLESDRFAKDDALPQAFEGSIVEACVQIASMLSDQLITAVAQALAGLAIDIEHGRLIVKKEEGVSRMVHKSAEARLARPQLLLGLPQLGDVLQDTKLPQRPSRVAPGHIALAVNGSHGAVRLHHPVLYVVAWTAGQQCGRGSLGDASPVIGVNQIQPSTVPRRQLDRLHAEDPANLV